MAKKVIYKNGRKYNYIGSYTNWGVVLNKIRKAKAKYKSKYYVRKRENWLFPQTIYDLYLTKIKSLK